MDRPYPLIRIPTEPARLTIFAVFALIGFLVGIICGMRVGYHLWGMIGGIAGAIIGGFVGFAIGRIPDVLMSEWMFRRMRRSSNEELRAIVDKSPWSFLQTLALLNLQVRGEDVQSYLPRVIELLESDDRMTRRFGRDAIWIVFTSLASRIEGYNPDGSTDECRRCAGRLRENGQD